MDTLLHMWYDFSNENRIEEKDLRGTEIWNERGTYSQQSVTSDGTK